METPLGADLLLEVKHLSVEYAAATGTVKAVTDVSLTLRRGEVLGLAGESGCGKSTLAYALARLLNPPAMITGGQALYYPHPTHAGWETGGTPPSPFVPSATVPTIRPRPWPVGKPAVRPHPPGATDAAAGQPFDILGLEAEELRAFRWNDLAIVFQSAMNALNPVMTIGAQMMDVLQTHQSYLSAAERKQRALELLQLVGIAADHLKSYPHELSGGMRQRAVIAIALALSPDIIIMDEPTTALDVVVQRDILGEILRLREQFGFSVIFITHDLSLLLELADRVAIMYAGRLVEQASSSDLYEHPRHPYSYGLIHSFPSLHGPRRRATGIPGSPPDLRAVPPGCAFSPRCPLAFTACTRELPRLLPVAAEAEAGSDQQVACHLYNAAFHAEPPTTAAIAAAYEASAERSGTR